MRASRASRCVATLAGHSTPSMIATPPLTVAGTTLSAVMPSSAARAVMAAMKSLRAWGA